MLELKYSVTPFSGLAMYVSIKSPLSQTKSPDFPLKMEIDLRISSLGQRARQNRVGGKSSDLRRDEWYRRGCYNLVLRLPHY